VQLEGVGSQGLSSQSPSGVAHPKDSKLERCAHEFEASLMAELLKPMQESDGLTGEDSGGGTASGGALSGFASESLARAISERGGFGIANRILQQLEPSNAGGTQKVRSKAPRLASSFSGYSRYSL
jgi:flagellar protein FlgJ